MRDGFLTRNFPGTEALAKLVVTMKNSHKMCKTVKGFGEEKLFVSADYCQRIAE
ncbi:hypothetical protein L579_2485 [Pantoea sp. AS-PWVM4]|nr:hypothetical protein L579_2485 [Pantoea sp. AS-PWVM4]